MFKATSIPLAAYSTASISISDNVQTHKPSLSYQVPLTPGWREYACGQSALPGAQRLGTIKLSRRLEPAISHLQVVQATSEPRCPTQFVLLTEPLSLLQIVHSTCIIMTALALLNCTFA